MFKLIVPDEEQLPQRLDECVILLRAKEKPCSSAKNDNRLGRYDLASFLSAIRILLRISCWFAADSTDSASFVSINYDFCRFADFLCKKVFLGIEKLIRVFVFEKF